MYFKCVWLSFSLAQRTRSNSTSRWSTVYDWHSRQLHHRQHRETWLLIPYHLNLVPKRDCRKMWKIQVLHQVGKTQHTKKMNNDFLILQMVCVKFLNSFKICIHINFSFQTPLVHRRRVNIVSCNPRCTFCTV